MAGFVAVLIAAGAMPRASATSEYEEWWSRASIHIQDAWRGIDAASRAVEAQDLAGGRAACQQLHDADTIGLQGDMPTPDPTLTAEVQRMIDLTDTGTHICMSLGPSTTQADIDRMISAFTEAMTHYNAAKSILAQHGIQAP